MCVRLLLSVCLHYLCSCRFVICIDADPAVPFAPSVTLSICVLLFIHADWCTPRWIIDAPPWNLCKIVANHDLAWGFCCDAESTCALGRKLPPRARRGARCKMNSAAAASCDADLPRRPPRTRRLRDEWSLLCVCASCFLLGSAHADDVVAFPNSHLWSRDSHAACN